jgi:hypothetical protein
VGFGVAHIMIACLAGFAHDYTAVAGAGPRLQWLRLALLLVLVCLWTVCLCY